MASVLNRETFRTPRDLDFFSKRELVTQTGHNVGEWPFVILKELLDNSLDVCEEQGIPPVVEISADAEGVSVADNGPGLPDSTIECILDFSVRASSREAYVSPTRGAQGNALKTLVAMPFVVDREQGRLVIESCGQRRVLRCRFDPITQCVGVERESTSASHRPGTLVRLEWSPQRSDDSEVVWPFDEFTPTAQGAVWSAASELDRIRRFLLGYALFNPHLRLVVRWFDDSRTWEPTNANWDKWRPNQPTSIHWYERQHFERLIGACVAADRQRDASRTVAAFVSTFDGLSGSQKRKRVLDAVGLSRQQFHCLVTPDGFRTELVDRLLAAMKQHTRPIKPRAIGMIGEGHFRARFQEFGCDLKSFEYARRTGCDDAGLPYVLETAFAWRGDRTEARRTLVPGVNWSMAIKNPFRSFGATGEGLGSYLSELRAGPQEPIIFAVHLAHPRVQYTDRGKSAITIEGASE